MWKKQGCEKIHMIEGRFPTTMTGLAGSAPVNILQFYIKLQTRPIIQSLAHDTTQASQFLLPDLLFL